jgi:hypothetical protein
VEAAQYRRRTYLMLVLGIECALEVNVEARIRCAQQAAAPNWSQKITVQTNVALPWAIFSAAAAAEQEHHIPMPGAVGKARHGDYASSFKSRKKMSSSLSTFGIVS